MRKGFTLVELSIVLVIIGLLIGGILVAQSMISTSRITAQTAQLQQFDAGVMNFKTKYNYLPGDAPAFGGDGDGVIDITGITTQYPCWSDDNTGSFACELANFWNNFNPQEYTGLSPGPDANVKVIASGAGKNVPMSKLGSPNSFFIATALTADGILADKTNPRNFYILLNGTQAQSQISGVYQFSETSSANSSVKPADLSAIEQKIDDGKGNSGNILSGAMGPYCCSIGGPTLTPLAPCSDGAGKYNVAQQGYECTPLIRIGGIAGDPQ